MNDVISSLHPFAGFLYFALVLAFAMYFTHPVLLLTSLLGALFYSFHLRGKRALRYGGRFLLPSIIIVSVLNPLFNHQGATILTYFPDGNPLTLESILYGLASGCMLITVVCWFSCFNAVMTSDKIIFLFGRVIPAMSLILSMTLRFVPRFKAQMLVIADAQSCVGRDVRSGGLLRRAKNGVLILSIMVTWALENAIETADSMKSRGYGLKGRTAFSNFRLTGRDGGVLCSLISCAGIVVTGALLGGFRFRYYPSVKGVDIQPQNLFLYLIYALLCFMPVILNAWEDGKWKVLQSAD